jgi:hypothetical protein
MINGLNNLTETFTLADRLEPIVTPVFPCFFFFLPFLFCITTFDYSYQTLFHHVICHLRTVFSFSFTWRICDQIYFMWHKPHGWLQSQ